MGNARWNSVEVGRRSLLAELVRLQTKSTGLWKMLVREEGHATIDAPVALDHVAGPAPSVAEPGKATHVRFVAWAPVNRAREEDVADAFLFVILPSVGDETRIGE